MSEQDEPRKFWAYKHINGHIQVKRFTSQEAIEDAYDSDFVDNVMPTFEAINRADAESKAKEYFGVQ